MTNKSREDRGKCRNVLHLPTSFKTMRQSKPEMPLNGAKKSDTDMNEENPEWLHLPDEKN